MLVLSRRFNEVIHIGRDITVRVLAFNHSHVRLGIEAPDGTRILRGELLQNGSSRGGRLDDKEEQARDGDVTP